jgi:hypothetical protein
MVKARVESNVNLPRILTLQYGDIAEGVWWTGGG